MILADTSVWIDHFRRTNQALASLLDEDEVCVHAFVIGELACGNLKNRAEILSRLHDLPLVAKAQDGEILALIDRRRLMGRGLGLVDVHVLASCLLDGHRLWTLDKPLKVAAAELGIEGTPLSG